MTIGAPQQCGTVGFPQMDTAIAVSGHNHGSVGTVRHEINDVGVSYHGVLQYEWFVGVFCPTACNCNGRVDGGIGIGRVGLCRIGFGIRVDGGECYDLC